MSKWWWFAAMSFAFGSVGCLSELTQSGSKVHLGTSAPDGMKCRELGTVYGSGGGGMYTSNEDKLASARNELRNSAAERGANFVVMDLATRDAASLSVSGLALWCRPRHSPPQAVAVAPKPAEPTPAKPVATAPTAEERLRTLEDLHQKGLLGDDEYQQRRKAIVDAL